MQNFFLPLCQVCQSLLHPYKWLKINLKGTYCTSAKEPTNVPKIMEEKNPTKYKSAICAWE